jgi:hypothetical protein
MTDLHDDRTMRERMLAGDLYIADDPELGEATGAPSRRCSARSASGPRSGRASPSTTAATSGSALVPSRTSGAVVTRDLPANVVAVGSPARVVRRIET